MTRRTLFPWIVLAASLLLTTAATWTLASSTRARDEERFENAVQSTRSRIEGRLQTYTSLLRGGSGLFAANKAPVTLEAFRRFTERLDVEGRYPGIQGIGFTQRFMPEERDSLVAAMQAQGFPDFRVWPDVPDPERHAIIYLEPLDRRNRAALGFDMFTEPTRRDAMARARDTGLPAMSGKVTLVQEIEGRVQAGFLIYYPVYRDGVIPGSEAERRAELEGYVYAPFRADDLFAGIFGREEYPRVAFRIYDGERAEAAYLLHDSEVSGIAPAADSDFTRTATLAFGGRTWTITFTATPFFVAESRHPVIPALAGMGLLLSLVLFLLSRAQVRTEATVRASEERLRTVLESLPVGVLVAARDGKTTFTNSAMRQIWAGTVDGGGLPEPLRAWRVETGAPIEAHAWALARALRGETVQGELIEIDALDGTHRLVVNSAFPLYNLSGKAEGAVAAMVDITPQRQAELALREREREFAMMINSIPQLVWVADAAGDIVWCNDRWYAYTGTTLETMQNGQGLYEVQHPEHAERVTGRIREAIRTGVAWEDTFPLRSHDGTYRWFLSQALPIHDEAGRIIRWFGTHTDITEQLQAREAEARALREQAARQTAEARAEQLRLNAAELERSNRELQDFAYVASHDLQEPLRKITAFADILQSEYGDLLDEQGRYFLERMQRAATRMSRLIRDLLAFSRVTSRARPFERVNLNDVLADVTSDLEVLLHETDGRVDVSPMPAITADPMQMRQLFMNLVGNALKFHRPHVPPYVQVRARIEEAELSSGTGPAEVCRIEVVDNGIGFEEKYLDRIFAPFQRLHGADAYEGTGIGLAICRRIVERHGGTITATSTPGSGSTFVVQLPLDPPAGLDARSLTPPTTDVMHS